MSTTRKDKIRRWEEGLFSLPEPKRRKISTNSIKFDQVMNLIPELKPLCEGEVPLILLDSIQKLLTKKTKEMTVISHEDAEKKESMFRLHNMIRLVKPNMNDEEYLNNYTDKVRLHSFLKKRVSFGPIIANQQWRDIFSLVLPFESSIPQIFNLRLVCRAFNQIVGGPSTKTSLMQYFGPQLANEGGFTLARPTVHVETKNNYIHYACTYLSISNTQIQKDLRIFHEKMFTMKNCKEYPYNRMHVYYLQYLIPHLGQHFGSNHGFILKLYDPIEKDKDELAKYLNAPCMDLFVKRVIMKGSSIPSEIEFLRKKVKKFTLDVKASSYFK